MTKGLDKITNKFVDEQLKGPYYFWHHTHTFETVNDGVIIKDVIKYSIPLGFIGRIMHFLWIKNDLNKVFNFRKKVIDEIFVKNEALENSKEKMS